MGGFIRYLAVFACAMLVLAAFIGATAVVMKYGVEAQSRGCSSNGGCEKLLFAAREWGTYGSLTRPIRLWMVDDLIQNVGVQGQTQAWVDANLGTPDKNDKLAERCNYSYWLGPVQALININSDWLCLNFSGGVVSEAAVVESS